MDQLGLVSIIMPVKNTATFLAACLDSILNQTYQNWELIAIDDYSEDESYKMLQSYTEMDARVKVVKNSGTGIIDALQLGYRHSQGEFITRMDSDDMMEPEKIALMVDQLQKKGNGYLAVGLVNYFSAGHLGEGYLNYANWLNQLTLSESNFDDIYKECSIPSPCWMVARVDFEACGGFASEVYPEDYDLAFRFRKGGLKVASVPKVIHQWRDYETRTSRTDANYSDNRFSEFKVVHFIDQDMDATKPLVLWGAGKKGKKIAQLLKENNILFHWILNNPNKIGRDIYGVILEDMLALEQMGKAQVIIAISSPDDAEELNRVMGKNQHHQYYRFF